MVLEGAHGCHDHDRIWLEAREAALDVQELLCSQIGTEASLGHAPVSERERHARSHDGVASMRDVGEGASMHEHRIPLQGLHQIRLQRILEKRAHGTFRLEVMRRYRLILIGVAHDDAT